MTVTRFAPSPTGYLHIGGLRTALFSWLWARRQGGKFLLRIEDTDLARNSQAATEAILEAFEWVGMSHDGEAVYQSQRFDLYRRHIARLLDEGKAYYCYMSKEVLDALREEQQKRGERPRYDGRYRDGTLGPVEGVEPVVRIKAPLEGSVTIEDGIKGPVTFNWDEVDDFIIARADGSPTYNFVVAIDDAFMGVSDVIRGDDHLSNTPKQLVVYRALGFKEPKFFHVPMILNEAGKKLSKRDGATDVMEYKHQGYLPEALLNFLVRLGWSHGDQEIFSLEEMLALFDPNDINKSASAYNPSKLLWLNGHYIKNSPNDRLIKLLHEEFECDIRGHDAQEILLDLCKEKAQTLEEVKAQAQLFISRPTAYNPKDLALATPQALELLERFVAHLRHSGGPHLPVEYQAEIDRFLKESGAKMPALGKPLRLALFGQAQGPSLSDALAILGIEEVAARLEGLVSAVNT